MKLLVSGSPHPGSANSRLLSALGRMDAGADYRTATYLADLPIFQPDRDRAPWPTTVERWRRDVKNAAVVYVCTPAYLHNLPGVLKNALDWLTSGGELMGKPTVAMTFTPAPPRGERVMQSLLWSLDALDARVLTSVALYQREVDWTTGDDVEGTTREIFEELLSLT